MTSDSHSSPSSILPILFEDNHLLAVVKQPGILSQADDTGEPDMVTLLKEDLKIRYEKPGNVYVGLIHRLDRPVGGAMLFAKTSKAASRLSESVRSRQFDKFYITVVHGSPKASSGRLRHYLSKDAARNIVTVYDKPTADAKEALLDYVVVAKHRDCSLIAVKLVTGRSHQIRAQMAAIHCPLFFDRKYGAPIVEGEQDIALWSASIGVAHPVTKEWMIFLSEPPRTGVWTRFSERDYTNALHILPSEGFEA
ncbi:RNA pseudouridine synthase [Paenibacillus baekrokdamisoli]|uniref:RNA pseudouridylate synthase n=1 Tax=Paenibacillus baekrokdamisoli TaxID=1712516 RepID=A0A3G9IN96_9BACL|nr:RluA family pseudouridine synthase [Paenibacillus baekrokdamisoli]MBB3067115.1 23S rRNA pseudouridine1911/1915/1917 synthase [Paenibacillus baekrokdamisoli]BBH19692.1 RNA pseudouridine synthase [Paenibacillus baekrokdamisoli]